MKKTKLTTGSNLLWEGSRMMLPEHKEAIIEQYNSALVKQRLEADEQRLEEISYIIDEAFYMQTTLEITTLEAGTAHTYIGVISRLDKSHDMLKLKCGDDDIKIKCSTIVDATSSL